MEHLCNSCEKEYPVCDGQPEFAYDRGGEPTDDTIVVCPQYKKEVTCVMNIS